jgi:hypothetical protein
MMGTGLKDALGSVRQMQWAASQQMLQPTGVCAPLTAPFLFLLANGMANLDRSLVRVLHAACP